MQSHAHLIPNLRSTSDPNTWYYVATFNGRGQWQAVIGPLGKEQAKRSVRKYNRDCKKRTRKARLS